jgi:FMN phosphatase YigB (HAD superfamily)
MKPTRMVVFDIGNVLLRFSKQRAHKNFERIDPGSGDGLVRAIWESRLGLDLEAGRINGRQFFKKAGRFRMSYSQFLEAIRDIFTPIPENLRLLKSLSKTHDTALLSNVRRALDLSVSNVSGAQRGALEMELLPVKGHETPSPGV